MVDGIFFELIVNPFRLRALQHVGREINTGEVFRLRTKRQSRQTRAAPQVQRLLEARCVPFKLARQAGQILRRVITQAVHKVVVETRSVGIEQGVDIFVRRRLRIVSLQYRDQVAGTRIFGIQLQHLLERCQGFLHFALVAQDIAEIVPAFSVRGMRFNKMSQKCFSLFQQSGFAAQPA